MKKQKKTIKLPRSIKRMFPNVTTIIDAKMPISVHVKDSDCKNAEPLNPKECAMARAAKREYKVDAAVIGISTSYIIKGNKATRFETPESVRREIVSFDRHSDFEPVDYYLTPKSPSTRLGVHAKSGKKTSGKNHSAKRRLHKTVKIREFAET